MGAIWRELCETYPELKGKVAMSPADPEKKALLRTPADIGSELNLQAQRN
jgi:hypothetical protein